MEKIILTCPFTGLDFEAVKAKTGDYLFTNPLTGQVLIAENGVVHATVESLFRRIETVSQSEAAKVLGVSRQRITQLLVSEKTIPYTVINGKKRILVSDLKDYQDNKKR